MIGWNSLYIFVIATLFCWGIASVFCMIKSKNKINSLIGSCFQWGGIFILSLFIVLLTIRLQRPPMRTVGEIRLWYALFLGVAGWLTYKYWHFSWVLIFTTILSAVFLLINLVRPEIHDQRLAPALQSMWFIPHVILYMFSYALLACACLIAIVGLIKRKANYLHACDNIVLAGVSFFTIAMLFGSLWAKVAWGHYWTWDAKELWAAITWMTYVFYLHLRNYNQKFNKISYWLLIIAFVFLQMCWYGINVLPSQRESLHTYF